MDKDLQIRILKAIEENRGFAEWHHILAVVQTGLRGNAPDREKLKTILKHQLDLLEKEDKVVKREQLPSIDYILTPEGHRALEPRLKRVWYFILYNKSNLFVLLALVISIISLVVSALK